MVGSDFLNHHGKRIGCIKSQHTARCRPPLLPPSSHWVWETSLVGGGGGGDRSSQHERSLFSTNHANAARRRPKMLCGDVPWVFALFLYSTHAQKEISRKTRAQRATPQD